MKAFLKYNNWPCRPGLYLRQKDGVGNPVLINVVDTGINWKAYTQTGVYNVKLPTKADRWSDLIEVEVEVI